MLCFRKSQSDTCRREGMSLIRALGPASLRFSDGYQSSFIDQVNEVVLIPAAHVNQAVHLIPVVASASKRSPNSGRRTQDFGALCRYLLICCTPNGASRCG